MTLYRTIYSAGKRLRKANRVLDSPDFHWLDLEMPFAKRRVLECVTGLRVACLEVLLKAEGVASVPTWKKAEQSWHFVRNVRHCNETGMSVPSYLYSDNFMFVPLAPGLNNLYIHTIRYIQKGISFFVDIKKDMPTFPRLLLNLLSFLFIY